MHVKVMHVKVMHAKVMHVLHAFLHIFLRYSSQQRREITKHEVLTETRG